MMELELYQNYGFYSRNSNVDLSKFKTLYTENELKKMKSNIN